jgi:hypothetical protein
VFASFLESEDRETVTAAGLFFLRQRSRSGENAPVAQMQELLDPQSLEAAQLATRAFFV